MSLTESTATSHRSSQPARVVLWSAVVAFAVSQFLSPLEGETAMGWYFSDWGNWIDSLWTSVLNGNIDWPAAIGLMLTTTLLAGLIAMPLLAEWLRKARPILWILRFLTLGGLALFALVMYRYWQITQSLAQKMMREPVGIPFLAGFWVFLAAFVLSAIGLWMIPKAVKRQPFNGPEIPNHG